MNSDAW